MSWYRAWEIDEFGDYVPGTIIHVWPSFGKTHYSKDCWCNPEPLLDNPLVMVHKEEH